MHSSRCSPSRRPTAWAIEEARVNDSKRFLDRVVTGSARRLASAALVAALAGCGGGADVEELPDVNAPQASDYNGPAPATADVQAFRINLWENVRSSNRCGDCHGTGGQT